MRNPRRRQSAIRAPLNEILGTEANVRILRSLVLARTPMTAGELAKRADLNRTSVYPALKALEGAGIVSLLGTGVQRQVQLRGAHPLARVLVTLFRTEARQLDDLVADLREVARTLRPAPTAVWIEGPVLTGTDRLDDPLVCYVLGDPRALPAIVEQLSERVIQIERDSGISIEVRGTTRSELRSRPEAAAAQLQDAILLSGVPPAALLSDGARTPTRDFRSHEEHDARARRLALAIALKLERHPELIRTARRFAMERQRTASARESKELQEWVRILTTMHSSRLRKFLTERSERATRLRQTLPFLDILSPAERDAVLASKSDAEVRAVVVGAPRGGMSR